MRLGNHVVALRTNGPEDPWGPLLWEYGIPQQSMNGVLDLLRDHVTLWTAQEELANITKENKLGDFNLGHIQAMVSFLNLFLDEDLEYTWKNASTIIAKAQGQGKMCAQAIREWVLCFSCTGDLPHHQMSWKHATVLADEEIAKAIQLALAEKGKSGQVDATTLIDVVSSDKMQARFVQLGIDKQSI